MPSIDGKLITQSILKLIDDNGIEDKDFANLIEKSTRTLARIRKGEALFNINAINVSILFFNKTLQELNSTNICSEANSRNVLKALHKDNPAFSSLLEKRPSITYAITYCLLNNEEFRSAGMTVDSIKRFLRSFGWSYSSSYISNAMVRNKEHIAVAGTKVADGNEVNIYKIK